MKVLGSSRLERQDLGYALQFVLIREYGLIGHIAGPLIITSFFIMSWWQGSTMFLLIGFLGIIGYVAALARGNETLLRLSDREVMARGNLERWTKNELMIPAEEITGMGWSAGGEDDSGGLYVQTKWRRRYVLPGAEKEQAHAIIEAIANKFPDFPIGETAHAWTLSSDSGITTLGLSQKSKKD